MRFQERYFCCLLVLAIILLTSMMIKELWYQTHVLSYQDDFEQHDIISDNTTIHKTVENCRTYLCVDVFKCQINQDWRAAVYVYPDTIYLSDNGNTIFPRRSNEYKEMLQAIRQGPMFTDDPNKACLFVPSSDILSEVPVNISAASMAFSSLPSWDEGKNHIIFNMVSKNRYKTNTKSLLSVQTGIAMVAGADFHFGSLRGGFDIPIPVFNSFTNDPNLQENEVFGRRRRRRLITFLEDYPDTAVGDMLAKFFASRMSLALKKCEDLSFVESQSVKCSGDEEFDYPKVLLDSVFCFVSLSFTEEKSNFLDILMMGCIPVILLDGSVLPFADVIDWQRASVRINPLQLTSLFQILRQVSPEAIREKQLQAFYLWKKYFSSVGKIALTTLEIVSERIFAHKAKQYEDWNVVVPKDKSSLDELQAISRPLFLPLYPAAKDGFTAVILTYNRVQMLHLLMERLSTLKSLAKIIVVWNNVRVDPPSESFWPKLNKPWVLIRQKTNRLSNRFFPYKEIETEAVLAIDDDILMLTADEIEFAFKTWLEFHDRLVGFPGRIHLTESKSFLANPGMKFKYESEWSNDISMVLTGAAFYHKVYNHWYTYLMPSDVREYVDEKMNCEDIAMNFLVANLTRKAPIKVTARKRFKCSQCHGNESLWSESSHFVKRSECLSVFTQLFGYMPLKTVEFRADPVLFQEDVPTYLQEFREVGTV